MAKIITSRGVVEQLQEKLQLEMVVEGEDRILQTLESGESVEGRNSVSHEAGYLNFIRPNQIQVLGRQELTFLKELGKNSHHDAIELLFSRSPVAVLIGDEMQPPASLLKAAQQTKTPLVLSPLSASFVVEHLRYHLARSGAQRTTLHGVFMEVMGIGVLLSGPSGIGKSELALELISRGHRLIADDAPYFTRMAPDVIIGKCPKPLRDYLEVRGLGLLNIRSMFGDNALKHQETLHLIVQLKRMSDSEIGQLDRLQGSLHYHNVLDHEVPEFILPVILGGNLAVLVEGAVRNHLLTMKGYNATEAFIERQKQFIAQGDK